MRSVSTQTDESYLDEVSKLKKEIVQLKTKVYELEEKVVEKKFRSATMDDTKLSFYTGFNSTASFKALYDFLGPSVHNLK
jgi:hypothetical protein